MKLGQILNHGDLAEGIDWKVNLGVAVLGMVLIISAVAVAAFLVIPLALGAEAPASSRFACSTSLRSGSATYWSRSHLYSALFCFSAIPLMH